MLSAKLTGLKSLAALNLDSTLLHLGFLKNDCSQPNEADKKTQEIYHHEALCSPLKTRIKLSTCRLRTVVLPSAVHEIPKLHGIPLYRPIVLREPCKKTVDQCVQTEPLTPNLSQRKPHVERNVEVLNSFVHGLNVKECSRVSKSDLSSPNESTPIGPPTLWNILAEFHYSPALFNLGVWHEHLARGKAPNPHPTENLLKAEQFYIRALLTDRHPTAAYNLACLLLSSKRCSVETNRGTYRVEDLMQIAASSGVQQAKKYLTR